MTERRLWIGGVIGLGVFTAVMLFVGNVIGPTRPEADPLSVEEVLAERPARRALGWRGAVRHRLVRRAGRRLRRR